MNKLNLLHQRVVSLCCVKTYSALPLCLNYQEHAKHYLQSHSHQEKRNLSAPFQTRPWMSHLHRHKPDQEDLSISSIFGCKETQARILACTQTLIHTHTVRPNRVKQSALSCDKQTHQGPRKRAFKFGQVVYHSSHPSAPLWVRDTDPGSAYCSQKHILIHNTSSSCCPVSVVR